MYSIFSFLYPGTQQTSADLHISLKEIYDSCDCARPENIYQFIFTSPLIFVTRIESQCTQKMLLFVFAVVSSIFLTQSSVTAALGKDDFLLTVYPDEVKGLKEVQHNFTLGLKCLTKECFGKFTFF